MMFRYGIVRWASRMPEEIWEADAPGRQLEVDSNAPPIAVWYEFPDERDRAMKAMAGKHLGHIFCPVEISGGMQIAPGDLVELTVTDKGVLPK